MTHIALGRDFIRDVERACRAAVEEIGFTTKRQRTFVHLTDDVTGTVGLNLATSYGDGTLGVNLRVGVRHEPIEQLIAEIEGTKYDPYGVATIGLNVGYLYSENVDVNFKFVNVLGADGFTDVLEKTYWEFEFVKGEPILPRALEIAEAVRVIGMPWMRAHSDIDSVIEALPRHSYWHQGSKAQIAGLILRGADAAELKARIVQLVEQGTREVDGRRMPPDDFIEFSKRAMSLAVKLRTRKRE